MLETPLPDVLRGKRIAILLGGTAFGGAERQALVLARYLRTVEHAEVIILGLGESEIMRAQCQDYGIPFQVQPFTGWWRKTRLNMVSGLIRYVLALRKLKFDVLIAYCMDNNLLAGISWRWAGAKGCIWNQVDEGRERRPGRWESLAVRQTSTFISNCTHGADFLRAMLGAPAGRIHVVYNGIAPEPAEMTAQQWRARLGLSEDTFVACMIANLTVFKDHITLLQAWRIVLDALVGKNQKVVLLLAGRLAEQTDRLKALAYDLNLGQSVQFLGSIKDTTGLIRATDLCVFSSRLEGCPNAVLECMAEGLSVTGTDIPGIAEAVGGEVQRFLAPPGNPEALAERIIHLALNKNLRIELGDRNRRRVQEVFSMDHMCQQATSLICAIIDHRV